jgi:putative glutamine amidotransferase
MKPIIGIAANIDTNRHGMAINSLPLAYPAAIEKAGGLPLVLPYSGNQALMCSMVERIDGLLLPGGIDLDPAWYNESPATGLEEVNHDLDIFQFELFEVCRRMEKPVFGICRGCQLINTALGGSLFQDIDAEWQSPALRHRGPGHDTEHPVTIEPGSLLFDLFGREVVVNSRHHQAIKKVGRDLRVTAVAGDGVIEAAEHCSLLIHFVQWHPERMLASSDIMLPLFRAFVAQCRKSREVRGEGIEA